jgi:hypothetical protein
MASDGVERAKAVSGFIASVIIPLALAYVGNQYSTALKESELQAQYVSMATDILADEPTADTKDLREWAIKIVNQYSEVPLGSTTESQLKSKVSLPKANLSDATINRAITAARENNDQEALRALRRYLPSRIGQP